MKEFKQDDRCYLAVEVPEEAAKFEICRSVLSKKDHKKYRSDLPYCSVWFNSDSECDFVEIDGDFKYNIIGLASQLTEEQAKEMVEEHVVIGSVLPNKYYNNYGEYECRDFRDLIDNSFLSATESLKSRLTFLKLSDNVLIIQKL